MKKKVQNIYNGQRTRLDSAQQTNDPDGNLDVVFSRCGGLGMSFAMTGGGTNLIKLSHKVGGDVCVM